MRTDAVPDLNAFLAFTVEGLKQRRAILADQLDALDRLIALNTTASLAEPLPGDADLPSAPSEPVFSQWKKDVASGRMKIVAQEGAAQPQDLDAAQSA